MIGNLPTVRSSALSFGMDCRMGCVQWYFCLGTRLKLGPSHPLVLLRQPSQPLVLNTQPSHPDR
jgi:hypothetical protein